MREFTYKGTARLNVVFLQIGGIVSILFAILCAAWLIVMAIQVGPSSYEGVGCIGGWVLIIGWMIGLTQINSAPSVWTEDHGLVISAFLFGRVRIPWTEIVDVGTGRVPFGHVLVRARRITPFHRVYGWLYSRTLLPSFLIRRDIQDRDALLCEIRERLEMQR